MTSSGFLSGMVFFQDHLVNIVNKNMPSVDRIIDIVFEANNRYDKELHRRKPWKPDNKKFINHPHTKPKTKLWMPAIVEFSIQKMNFVYSANITIKVSNTPCGHAEYTLIQNQK